jgi:hypothetical protein
MPDSFHPTRLTRARRGRLLAAGALVSGILVAGCGGSSASPTATAVGAASTSTSSAQSAGGSGPLAFAKCMRANGVPNFPDPNPGRGQLFSLAGIDPTSPAFRAAQVKCRKLMGGGPPVPGSTTHPSGGTMAKLRKIAVCMRQHGVPQFPDPQAVVPSNPSGIRVISDFDGAVLLFPSTINMQAPAYRHALAACGAPPLGLQH